MATLKILSAKLLHPQGGIRWMVVTYPLWLPFVLPIRLIQSLWNCRSLLGTRARDYVGCTTRTAMNRLFYRTQYINLTRYGRNGTSPIMGLGAYPMRNFFFASVPALRMFSAAGALLPVAGMTAWLLAHGIWLERVSPWWLGGVLLVTACTTLFYANAFYYQNYNAVGWVLVPLALYLAQSDQAMALAVVLLVIGNMSITAVVVVSALMIPALLTGGVWMWLSFVPLGLFVAGRLGLISTPAAAWSSVVQVAKAIGVTRGSARYPRVTTQSLIPHDVVFFVTYGQFLVTYTILAERAPWVSIVAFALYWLNQKKIRFADHQSVELGILTAMVLDLVVANDPWLLLSFWVAASPQPALILPGRFLVRSREFGLPSMAPFDVTPLVDAVERFLEPVTAKERVLMAFEDPKGAYENLFDGYRVLLELPLFVAARKEAHFMPDWWAVFETNYEGAPDFWGRSVDLVSRRVRDFTVDFVVIYQPAGQALGPEWTQAGFKLETDLDWSQLEGMFDWDWPYDRETPHWWLLRSPARV